MHIQNSNFTGEGKKMLIHIIYEFICRGSVPINKRYQQNCKTEPELAESAHFRLLSMATY